MRRMTISVCLVLVALVGCFRLKPTTPSTEARGAPAPVQQPAATTISSAPPPAGPPSGSVASTPAEQPPSIIRPTREMPTQGPVTSIEGSAATAATPLQGRTAGAGAGKIIPATPLKPPTSSAARTTPLSKQPVAAAASAKPMASAALDLAGLEQRLRETRAIGVFTKLTLKNQVDDLLEQFRAFHRGQIETQLAELRQRYDLLLLKVLTLLQDSDPQLAAAIASSREAIWAILTDPEKFAKI
jgi:hypothetical protein